MTIHAFSRLFALVTLGAGLLGCAGGDDPDADSDLPTGIVAGDAGLLPEPPPERDAGPTPPPLCPPYDGFGDNDIRARAAPLESGQEVEATFCGGEDWFSLEVDAGCQLEVRLRSDPRLGQLGDLDLLLYGPDGTLVGSSSTLGDSEHLSVTTRQAGAYAARVRGGKHTSTSYRVRMTATCASELRCPADDQYEENDTLETAHPLSSGAPVVGIVCPADDDWFSLPTPRGCLAVAELEFTHAEGNLNLRFVRPDGTDGSYSLSATDNERAVESGTSEGPLYVRVYATGERTNTYRLVLNRVCEHQLACPGDDPFEPNNERAAAARLVPPVDVPATVCGANEDWYRIAVSAGCTLDVEARFSHADADIDLELRNASDTILASSRSSTDDEALRYTASSFTTSYLRVFANQGRGAARYRLSAVQTCPDEDP